MISHISAVIHIMCEIRIYFWLGNIYLWTLYGQFLEFWMTDTQVMVMLIMHLLIEKFKTFAVTWLEGNVICYAIEVMEM